MPDRCQAPGCDYNYESEIKKRKSQNPEDRRGIFEFPKSNVDSATRKKLLSRIPREWCPAENQTIHLCESHFRPEDVIKESTDSNPRRKRKKETKKLKRKRITDDAIPCKWPGNPSYLTHVTVSRPTTCSSSEAREENAQRHREEIENARIEKDTFRTFAEFIEKEKQLSLPDGVQTMKTDNYVIFFKVICKSDIPKISYSLKIDSNLQIIVCQREVKVKNSIIRSFCTAALNTCSAINEILHYLDLDGQFEITDQDVIDDAIEKLSDDRFDGNVKVAFILEQLTLLFKSPNGRRYSPSLLATACLLQRMSPTCYKQMYKDAFLTLPSPDYLRRLCSAVDLDTLTISESTIAYLKARFQKLPERERLISVLMDEVYSQLCVQFVSGNVFGAENGKFTKTLLCVMLKSIAGKYRDIIAMVPVVNINAGILYDVWKNVMKVTAEIGFDVAVTMTDGHSSNMSLFNSKILKNAQDLCVENEFIPCSIIHIYSKTITTTGGQNRISNVQG